MMKKLFFIVALLSMFSPWVTPPVALIAGILFGQFSEHPYRHLNGSATQILLQISVIGLAFGMNVTDAVQAGKDGFFFHCSYNCWRNNSGLLVRQGFENQ